METAPTSRLNTSKDGSECAMTPRRETGPASGCNGGGTLYHDPWLGPRFTSTCVAGLHARSTRAYDDDMFPSMAGIPVSSLGWDMINVVCRLREGERHEGSLHRTGRI